MGKNIVICCDGTSNQFKPNKISNVFKRSSVLDRSDAPVLYSDPGVGTVGAYSALTPGSG